MSVIRVEKTKNYTVMSNYHFKERGMSLKAKGLLSLMLSLPPDWDFTLTGLVTLSKDNVTAVRTALKELQEFGYLVITKSYPGETESGRIEYDYTVYEFPQVEEKQPVENLYVENQTQLSTQELSTKNKELLDTKVSNRGFSKPKQENPISNKSTKTAKPLIEKETKAKKKVADILEMRAITSAFSENGEVRKVLGEYFLFRLSRGLQPNQWKLLLDNLREYAGSDAELAISKIKDALAGGYMQIIAPWEKGQKGKSSKMGKLGQAKFDNTANHKPSKAVASMTQEERKQFEEKELARDASGKLIKF